MREVKSWREPDDLWCGKGGYGAGMCAARQRRNMGIQAAHPVAQGGAMPDGPVAGEIVIGGHGRYAIFQMAEAAIPRDVFAGVLGLIKGLRGPPAEAACA
jgi:hypothetical protein